MAEAYRPSPDERGRQPGEEALAGRNQRKGWRRAGLLDQSLNAPEHLVLSVRRGFPKPLGGFFVKWPQNSLGFLPFRSDE